MAFAIHQDQLLWSRVQTLIAITAGTISGSYVARGTVGGLSVAVIGFIATGLLAVLALKDENDRNQQLRYLDEISRAFIDDFKGTTFYGQHSGNPPQISEYRAFGGVPIRGGVILRAVFALMLLVETALIVVQATGWDTLAARVGGS